MQDDMKEVLKDPTLRLMGLALLLTSIAYLVYVNLPQKVAARSAQDSADAQPRVIREIDGCKVYAFKSNGWHYFTRCPSSTSTAGSGVTP